MSKAPFQLDLITFEYEEDQPFRTLYKDGEPWFVVSDVCKALGISNARDAASRLDEDDVGVTDVIDSVGRKQKSNITNESGLYELIFRSNKPEAKKFKKWVTKEVLPSIRKSGGYGTGRIPIFVKRFNENWDRVDTGYFSVISELYVRVYGKLEQVGYIIPDEAASGKEIRPDVSVGLTFPKWLESHPDSMEYVGKRKKYKHLLPNGKEVEAWQYSNDVLPVFIQFIDEEWLPNRSFNYFRDRDRKALDYIPLALPAPKANKTNRKRQK